MRTVVIVGTPGPAAVRGWRNQARRLLDAEVPPTQIAWSIDGSGEFEFAREAHDAPPPGTNIGDSLRLSRDTLGLLERVGCHRAAERFAQMYAAVWRLHRGERHLFDLRHDPLVQALHTKDAAVRSELHKTKAFVRFAPRTLPNGEIHYSAWFEPEHDAIELVLPFFQRRFANMNWSILTPGLCVRWDGAALHRAPGIAKPITDGPDAADATDPLAAAWPIYYASVFNPARLKVRAMIKEMPKRYWRNLPEARLIPGLVAAAEGEVDQIIAAGMSCAPACAQKAVPITFKTRNVDVASALE